MKNEHLCALVNDELRVDVVASWCFTRHQFVDGSFNLFYCRIARQIRIGGGCYRKRDDFTRLLACEVSVWIWDRPIFRSCEAIAFEVTGHVLPPVSLFVVCHILQLECDKSADSTTSGHLALRTSSNLWSSAVVSMSSLVVACWCSRRTWLQVPSHPRM